MIRSAIGTDTDELLRMRKRLFSEYPTEELRREIEENHTAAEHPYYEDIMTFVYEKSDGTLGGFVDISAIRTDKIEDFSLYEEYCPELKSKSTLPRLEAWYVDVDLRRQEIGKALVKAAEEWTVERGFRIVLSDTDTLRETSVMAHESMGYEMVAAIPDKKLMIFLKRLVRK